jgi:hypothetical protein
MPMKKANPVFVIDWIVYETPQKITLFPNYHLDKSFDVLLMAF